MALPGRAPYSAVRELTHARILGQSPLNHHAIGIAMTSSAPTYNTHQFQVLFVVVRNAHVSANRENHKNYNSSGSLLEPHLRAQM